MKNLELTEKEVEQVLTALSNHYTWAAANDLIHKISEQVADKKPKK